MALLEPELMPTQVLDRGNRDFGPVCSCNLDLDPMTFIYQLEPYSLEIHRMCSMNFPCQGFRKLSSDRQTDRQTDTTELYHAPSRVANIRCYGRKN